MGEPKARHVTWHATTVTRPDRETIAGHKGCTIWLTGLSASGKSTIANVVEKALWERNARSYILDGDNIRHGLNKDLGFSPEDRTENIRRIGEVAKLFTDAGIIAITAFISPYRADRNQVRALLASGDFIEVYVSAPLDICEQRDPKGLYKKARAGKLPEFTGISAPYEEPEHAELTLYTEREQPDEAAQRIIGYLEEHGYISAL